jgi:hypothetical protein
MLVGATFSGMQEELLVLEFFKLLLGFYIAILAPEARANPNWRDSL